MIGIFSRRTYRRKNFRLGSNYNQTGKRVRKGRSLPFTAAAVGLLVLGGVGMQFINTNAESNSASSKVKEYIIKHLDEKYATGSEAKQVGRFILNPVVLDQNNTAVGESYGQSTLYETSDESEYYVGYAGNGSIAAEDTALNGAEFSKGELKVDGKIDQKSGLFYIKKADFDTDKVNLYVKASRVLNSEQTQSFDLSVKSDDSSIASLTNQLTKVNVFSNSFNVQIADAFANTNINKLHVYLNGDEEELAQSEYSYAQGRVYINRPVATVHDVQINVDSVKFSERVAETLGSNDSNENKTADKAQSYILDNLDSKYAKGNKLAEVGSIIVRPTYFDKVEIEKQGLDPSKATIDEVFYSYGKEESPKALVVTYDNFSTLYDVDSNSDYYVAYVDTFSPIGEASKIQDVGFARSNINGEIVDGYFDYNTGLAYIKKSDMMKDGQFDDAGVQVQTMQVIDFTNTNALDASVSITVE